MRFNFLTVLAVISVMMITTALIRSTGERVIDLPESEIYSCTSNAECVAVPADGCGCTSGGKDTAINRKYEDQWRKRQSGIMCTMIYVECNERPECVKGSCKLVPTE